MDLYITDDMIDLFRLIKERNILARKRFNKRQKAQYLIKILGSKLKNRITGKHENTPVGQLRKATELANADYIIAREELSKFTKENRHLRLELRRKFNTKQFKSACNTINAIVIDFLGSTFMFSSADIDRIVLENEINDILLGAPQV